MFVWCQSGMPNTTIFSSHPKANKMNRTSCTTQGKLVSPAKQESYKNEGHGGGAKKGDSAGGGIRARWDLLARWNL